MKLLIELGADIDFPDWYGYAPIMIATRVGSVKTVQILIESKANIHAVNTWGGSCLHLAAAFNRHEIALILLETKIDRTMLSNVHETALAIAINNNDQRMIAILTNNK